jgi:hypothetical protein
VGALHFKAADGDHINSTYHSAWQAMETGTIAEVVVTQGCLIAEDICLKLFVLQVFRYNLRLLPSVTICMLNASVGCNIDG